MNEEKQQRIYDKLVSGEKLSESEIKWMVFDLATICKGNGENRKWSSEHFTNVELFDKEFSIYWSEEFINGQKRECWDQPNEVEKYEIEPIY